MSNQALVPIKPEPEPVRPLESLSVFGSVAGFEVGQRMARALCSSPMVPDTYRGEANIGSCLIALEMANRIGANVLSVCQSLYIVHGKPAWSSQFLIACVNASGKFSPLRYKMTGDPKADSFGCIAWATDKAGERLESPEITIGTAKAEGWFQKNGSKWKTMPELMLRYRAATLFSRLYAPELSLGIHTDDEVIDIVEVSPVVTEGVPDFTPRRATPPAAAPALPAVEPETEAPKRRGRPPNQPAAKVTTPAPSPETEFQMDEPNPPRAMDAPSQPAQSSPPAGDSLYAAMQSAGVTSGQVLAFYNKEVRPDQPEVKSLADLSPRTRDALTKNLQANAEVAAKIREMPPV